MIGLFARHPTAANLLMFIFIGLGVFSLGQLRRETFPDITPSKVEIRVVYPGASAEDVEESICVRIEDAVEGINFVKEVIAEAREGVGVVSVEMEDGGNVTTFLDDIKTEVNAIDKFPEDAETPVIRLLGRTDPVLTVLVAGPMAVTDLKAYCEDLKDRLQQESGASLVKIKGFSDRQLRVQLSPDALKSFGLSASGVADIISNQSINLPAGGIETEEQEILIRFVEERRTVRELEDLIIVEGPAGSEVRLRQLGTVVDLFETEEEKILLGGRRAGQLQIEKTKKQDTIRAADEVKAFLEKERLRHPQMDIRVTQDLSVLVNDRLMMLLKNGWQGMVLVFLTLWLFFNLRLSFWVAMSLPVSFLGALFFMPYLGLTINMLTMVGLLLALGLLMDDGIVIAENIATHLSRGKPAMQAAIDGVSEVWAGVFSSFITTVFVLGPLAFIAGDIGKVLKVVPIILIVVLIVSLVEAFFILPAHLGHSLHHVDPKKPGRFRRAFDNAIDWVRERILGRTIDALIRWRYLFVGSVIGVFLLSASLVAGGGLQFQAFPEIDGDVIVARVLLPQGAPLRQTDAVVKKLTDALDRVDKKFAPLQPDGQPIVQTVTVRFNENAESFEKGPHVASLYVDLLTAEQRNGRLDDIMQAWREETGRPAGVLSLTFAEPVFGPAGRPIEVRLHGRDLDRLKAGATEMIAWLSRFDGVANLADDLRSGKVEVRIRLREGAVGLGLNAKSMAQQLRSAFHGVTAAEIQVGSEPYEIDVRVNPQGQDSLSDLDYFEFTLSDGTRIPLGAVAEVEYSRGRSRIARIDGMRTVTVRGDVDTRKTNTAALLAKMNAEFLPKFQERNLETRVSFEGEVKESNITMGSMRIALLVGLAAIFVLLSFQFRSYIEPLIVMLAIPLALIGIIWGHLLMGHNLSMPSVLGFASLAGVVVNDSILLVLFLKKGRSEGKDIAESAAQSSRQRFRAILLTSLTTIAGLLPLLAERSLQAQVLIPLAISIAFGLMASTVLVLLVIPCLYVILGDFGLVSPVAEEDKSQ